MKAAPICLQPLHSPEASGTLGDRHVQLVSGFSVPAIHSFWVSLKPEFFFRSASQRIKHTYTCTHTHTQLHALPSAGMFIIWFYRTVWQDAFHQFINPGSVFQLPVWELDSVHIDQHIMFWTDLVLAHRVHSRAAVLEVRLQRECLWSWSLVDLQLIPVATLLSWALLLCVLSEVKEKS